MRLLELPIPWRLFGGLSRGQSGMIKNSRLHLFRRSEQNVKCFRRPAVRDPLVALMRWRRGSESNRRIKVLQTPPLPLGYRAIWNILPPGQNLVDRRHPALSRKLAPRFPVSVPGSSTIARPATLISTEVVAMNAKVMSLSAVDLKRVPKQNDQMLSALTPWTPAH
jgi:hypothetical protein